MTFIEYVQQVLALQKQFGINAKATRHICGNNSIVREIPRDAQQAWSHYTRLDALIYEALDVCDGVYFYDLVKHLINHSPDFGQIQMLRVKWLESVIADNHAGFWTAANIHHLYKETGHE